jgi:acetylornithine deacetylase/succinyl-diaminopimelate desuccinylase-like protein
LVWGPGSLAQAHAIDEYVVFAEVQQTARLLAQFAAQWCGTVKDV